MDILYVVGRRLSQWNDNELRYSLRSIDKYGVNVGRVFIAGYCPPFVDRDAVRFVPVKDATPVKHYNIQRAIEAAVEQTEIGDEFLYSSDDHFYIAPTDFDHYPFYWRGVELPMVARTEYERTLVSTRRLLECCGLPTKHLAWHGNTHFCRRLWESERFALMRRFALTMPDGCEPTCLMLNYRLAVEGVELTAREDCKFNSATSADELTRRMQGREVVSSTDGIEHSVLAQYLQREFKHKSRYEL